MTRDHGRGSAVGNAVLPVSVVIPAYRRADLVGRAVARALAQRPRPDEVIVVDDASGDGTAAAAETAGATVVRLERNAGEGGARDAGLAAARNDWVALLDSDDEWLPGHLARLWPYREGKVLVADSGRGTASGRVLGNPFRQPLTLVQPGELLWPDNPVLPSAAMVHRQTVQRAGGFSRRSRAGDLETWLRLLDHGPAVVLPEIGCRYHEHPGQVSQDRAAMRRAVDEVMAANAERGWYRPALCDRVAAGHQWDELRAALRRRDRAALLAAGRALALNPRGAAALPTLWRWRAAARQTVPTCA